MKFYMFFMFAMGLAAGRGFAANIAIVDSGVDYKHVDLVNSMWHDTSGQTTDSDGTVYKDDTNGWNFADKNNQVIDYKYLGTFSADCTKYFQVQGEVLLGTVTQADKDWYNAKKNDSKFLDSLETFGNFVHGTHVSGIASKDASGARLIPMKLIPTEKPTNPFALTALKDSLEPHILAGDNPLAKMALGYVAQQQGTMLVPVAKYINATKGTIANGSFGISEKTAEPVVKQLLSSLLGQQSISASDLKDYSEYFVEQVVTSMTDFVTTAPNTLFVFAAGNDGTDNDQLASAPANIKKDNTIAVAASLEDQSLASFSSYGNTMVEVAAPGVVINSSVPGNEHMTLSGTSMAAPYVTNIAGQIQDKNPSLKPVDIKKIIIETVDVKDFLKGKVSSSGIANLKRAVRAAELSVKASLQDAITQAKADVRDVEFTRSIVGDDKDITPIPLVNPLKL